MDQTTVVMLAAPLFLIQVALIVIALKDLFSRGQENIKGPFWVWFAVIVFLNLLGPLLYFVIGRKA
ncbi:PLDc N-terminal domain-containing protein [Exiguobacterium flavidum]|uniref:PLDc N-terminal domain-containing protein n=1 Tax=Exiguobacterium flavidum TaxID=2184695 RepID=UPI000DF813FC|nr:PLDc N-terminal domain-containing protein [Exiguobacterium flavidum]